MKFQDAHTNQIISPLSFNSPLTPLRDYLTLLMSNSFTENENCLSRFSINESLNYPLIVSDRIFKLSTKECVNKKDIFDFLIELYCGTTSRKAKMYFDIFDLGEKGEVYESDVVLCLKSLHLSCGFKFSPNEVDLLEYIVNAFFHGKKCYHREQFNEKVFKSNSDIFVLMELLLNKLSPLNDESVKYFQQQQFSKNIELPNIEESDNLPAISKYLNQYIERNFVDIDTFLFLDDDDCHYEIEPTCTLLPFALHKDQMKARKFEVISDKLFYYKFSNKKQTYQISCIIPLKNSLIEPLGYITANGHVYIKFQLQVSCEFKTFGKEFYIESEKDLKLFIDCANSKSLLAKKIEDEYDTGDIIGKGQFGEIILGTHKISKEKVAIKILKKEKFSENKTTYEMVKWELEVFKCLKKINHPGIIKGYDYYESSTELYLVFEYISGGNLRNFLNKNRDKLVVSDLNRLILQISDALKMLHRNGIVHRDLKPENILFNLETSSPWIKIIDFGLSKIMGEHELTSEPYGTLCYSAPEIILRLPYSIKVDIWSFGVLAFYIYFGNLPFDDSGDDLSKICQKIISGKVEFKLNKNYDISPVKRLIAQCMKVDPKSRIFAHELHRCITKLNNKD